MNQLLIVDCFSEVDITANIEAAIAGIYKQYI